MREGEAFGGYVEAPLTFKPTYKFDSLPPADATRDAAAAGGDDPARDLDVYDSSPKRRVPSYTDRVLLAAKDGAKHAIVDYGSVEDLRSSDHRPVAATLSLSVDADAHATAGGRLGQHQSQVCAVM